MIQGAMPVRTEHDKVCLVFVRLLENIIDGETNESHRFDTDAGGDQRLSKRLQARIWRGEAFCCLRWAAELRQ